MAVPIESITTAAQLLDAGDNGRCEMIRGRVVRLPHSVFDRGMIATQLAFAIHDHVAPRKLGVVTIADCGYWIEHDPDTVRAPDVGFIRSARAPARGYRGYIQGPPDLAVEVLSPRERAGEVTDKVQQWLAVGAASVWVVEPKSCTVTVCHPDQNAHVLAKRDTLVDEGVLPGFATPVATIFE